MASHHFETTELLQCNTWTQTGVLIWHDKSSWKNVCVELSSILQKVQTQKGLSHMAYWRMKAAGDAICSLGDCAKRLLFFLQVTKKATLPQRSYIHMWRDSSTASFLHFPWRGEVIATVLEGELRLNREHPYRCTRWLVTVCTMTAVKVLSWRGSTGKPLLVQHHSTASSASSRLSHYVTACAVCQWLHQVLRN